MEFIPYKANECFEHLYYQIPMELFFNKNYKYKLNSDSKILYGFLLNRLALSIKNNWFDEEGNVFLIFTRKEVQELLNYQKVAYEKVNPLKSERENLWKKLKRVKTEDEKVTIESQIVEISKKITPLAEEIKYFNNIKIRLDKIRKFELHQKFENELKQFEKEHEKKIKIKR